MVQGFHQTFVRRLFAAAFLLAVGVASSPGTPALRLATTLRFAYADRGTGQLWTPWLNAWNIRVGRSFALSSLGLSGLRGARLDASLDVFNVTNNGSDQQFVSGGHQVNGQNFGLLTNRQLPRSAQAVVRLQF